MNISESKIGEVMRWDTRDNKIYFNIERGSVDGRLILRRAENGRIDMQIIRSDDAPPSARLNNNTAG